MEIKFSLNEIKKTEKEDNSYNEYDLEFADGEESRTIKLSGTGKIKELLNV